MPLVLKDEESGLIEHFVHESCISVADVSGVFSVHPVLVQPGFEAALRLGGGDD